MKNTFGLFIISVIAILLTANNSNGNNYSEVMSSGENIHSGIYMSAKDYQNRKLSLEINCDSTKHKIKLHDFFSKPYIDVIHEGKKYHYMKDSIFGYRDCNGNDFRFDAKREYQIMDSDSITIYRIQVAQGGKGAIRLVSEYYFSSKLDGKIFNLTSGNVKAAYPINHKFHDTLDMQFKDGFNLSDYDSFHKTYKIVRLLKLSYENQNK